MIGFMLFHKAAIDGQLAHDQSDRHRPVFGHFKADVTDGSRTDAFQVKTGDGGRRVFSRDLRVASGRLVHGNVVHVAQQFPVFLITVYPILCIIFM